MRDIGDAVAEWLGQGRGFAVGSVVGVSGSAPRGLGAALAVDTAGEAVGSVSGGCVEAEVYALCRAALESGRPVLRTFGYSDDDAFAVGLTCGGTLDVFVQPIRPGACAGMDAAAELLAAATPFALVRCIDGPPGRPGRTLAVTATGHHGDDLGDGHHGGDPAGVNSGAGGVGSGGDDVTQAVVAQARAMLAAGRTGRVTVGLDGQACDPGAEHAAVFFVETYAPPPRMLVFGAIDFAAAVCRIGRFLGYDVTVCDARPVFATARRFPDAHRVVVEWPHRYLAAEERAGRVDGRTVVCVLTHDAKFDVPLLGRALRMPLGFVGAMGSRRTHAERLVRLGELGLTEAELAKLHAPVGLDLGARTPEETAVAIAAEIIAVRHDAPGLPLTGRAGRIHRDSAAAPLPMR